MNETLKRRLIGLLLIILMLFIFSLILPKPGEAPPESEAVQRVTLDLQASEVQPDAAPPVLSPLPPVIAAAQPVAPQSPDKPVADTEPDIEEPAIPETASHAATRPATQLSEKPKAQSSHVPSKLAIAKPPQAAVKPNTKLHWFVQLGAFYDVDKARELLNKYKAQKYSGILSPLDRPKGPLYRVRLGPYAMKEQAAETQKRMIKAGLSAAALIEE